MLVHDPEREMNLSLDTVPEPIKFARRPGKVTDRFKHFRLLRKPGPKGGRS